MQRAVAPSGEFLWGGVTEEGKGATVCEAEGWREVDPVSFAECLRIFFVSLSPNAICGLVTELPGALLFTSAEGFLARECTGCVSVAVVAAWASGTIRMAPINNILGICRIIITLLMGLMKCHFQQGRGSPSSRTGGLFFTRIFNSSAPFAHV
ncbi:hypothetical protein [Serratia marcescens]|uniref:hypothetical protein n=1 Tax=Serratia marcescens TaxID=615 RepID=UPI0021BD15CA|nr:hypothetical protein [Serratia marcescens]